MKLKQRPEDFQVEELTGVVPVAEGPYALYRLSKRGWTTPDALAAVRRRWKIAPRRISYGGLKDRHASTVQYFTIFHGPQRKLQHDDVHVEYLGQLCQPYTSGDIVANRFTITLRRLTEGDLSQAEKAIEDIIHDGVPNYFDDQRFGSVAGHGRFMAKELILGRLEEALKLALTAPYEFDRAQQKKDKSIVRQHWGDWQTCKQRLLRGQLRSIVDYLVNHPDDFRGAILRLQPEVRGLYLSAYQSYLWNRLLARWLKQVCHGVRWLSLRSKMGVLPVPLGLDEEYRRQLMDMELPLPSGRERGDEEGAVGSHLDAILAEEGIRREQLKLKEIPELFFSKGRRSAWFIPEHFHYNSAIDDMNTKFRKLEIGFDLPRGSYATMVIKRIITPAEEA